MSNKTEALLFLADGFEEVEAITCIDYIRRAGIGLITVGVGSLTKEGAHGLSVQADIHENELEGDYDAVILPGGMPGSENLARSKVLRKVCIENLNRGSLVAAICAAPAVALGRYGILEGRQYTCYPGFERCVKTEDAHLVQERVHQDGNLITSRGPGTAAEFALAIVAYMRNWDEARKVEEEALLMINH